MKTVFFDVDTQLDFLLPAGALYVPGAEKLISTWARLREHAASNGITVISTMDAHVENDPEFEHWPPHCIVGTHGQRKPEKLLHDDTLLIPFRYPFDAFSRPLEAKPHIVVHKDTTDCFSNPHLPSILEQLQADRYVVYGVVTEICVKSALFGLLKTGARVELLADAVKELDRAAADRMIHEFQARGGGISTVGA